MMISVLTLMISSSVRVLFMMLNLEQWISIADCFVAKKVILFAAGGTSKYYAKAKLVWFCSFRAVTISYVRCAVATITVERSGGVSTLAKQTRTWHSYVLVLDLVYAVAFTPQITLAP